MPFGAVVLKPGVSIDTTPTYNQAGIQTSQLIRFRDQLVQKMGGWTKFYPFAVGGVPRDLHAWQDLNKTDYLSIGTTTNFSIISGGTLQNITPQTLLSDNTPNFSTTNGSSTVEITDSNIDAVTTFDSVFFNTPVSVGGLILSGLYPIAQVTGAHAYEITAESPATSSETNAGAVPIFTTVSASAVVNVEFPKHGLSVDDTLVFQIPTTFNGVTIDGRYTVTTVTDPDNFSIQVNTQATANGSHAMNGGDAELLYYIALGPPAGGIGYGLGGYGLGGYGTGVTSPVQTGTPITATDWTSDNWGEIILGCPADGGIYYYSPTGGFLNMSLVSSGPIFNSGIFVSTSQQILIAYGSTLAKNSGGASPKIGVIQDPMLVQWSDSENFLDWTPTDANFAGNFRIPIGSKITAGMAVANQNLIWTDLDLWVMKFIDQPNVYGFDKIGAGAGAAGRHAIMQMRGAVYWMGRSNFYVYDGGGVRVIPCPVWDAVFQNLNTGFIENVRAMPNTPFNEAGFFYPSLASVSGECDSYVKFNITEPGTPWDIGPLPRSAWIDQTVLGMPIAATPGGVIYQQETTNDADGSPLLPSFTTTYFYLSEGEEFVGVDRIYPDFIWGTYAGAPSAQIQLTLFVVDFPGETPRQFGPYTVTQATKFISVRLRGRQMALRVSSSDVGSFWRLGRIRFRFGAAGRR